jgi:hypothetical protein
MQKARGDTMARPLNSDELGAKGEQRFGEFCQDAKLKPNKSDRDRTGWDYLVTWPLGQDDTLDRRAAPLSCFAQVKTIWAGRTSIELNLGTLENIAKDARPAFIVIIEVAEADLAISRVSLIHLMDDFLADVLKRLRRAHADGKRPNKVKFVASVSKWARALAGPTGRALREAIEELIDGSMGEYGARKVRQLEELGYERGCFKLETTIEANSHEEIIEGFLGARPLRLLRANRLDSRFGIDVQVGSFNTANSTIEIQPRPIDACKITVTRQRDGGVLTFAGKVFVPPANVVGPGRVVLEVRSELFRIGVDMRDHAGKVSATINLWSLPQNAIVTTADRWRDFFRFMGWTFSELLTVEIRGRKRLATPIRGTTTPEVDLAEAQRLESLAHAADAVDWAMLRADAPGTKLGVKEMFDAADQLDLLRTIEQRPSDLSALRFTTRVSGTVEGPLEHDMLYFGQVPLGDQLIAYAARTRIKGEMVEDTVAWTASPLQLAVVRKIRNSTGAFRAFRDKALKVTGVRSWFAPAMEAVDGEG